MNPTNPELDTLQGNHPKGAAMKIHRPGTWRLALHPLCRPTWLLITLVCATGLQAQAPAPETTDLPTLTQIDQVRRLNLEQAKRGYPVRLRAVVTYYASQGFDF